jgi:hypothetical protein
MTSTTISWMVLVCTIGGVAIGSVLRHLMPDHHVRDDSKDLVKIASGLIATLVAMVLGLLVATAKGSFDTANNGFTQIGAKIILLDRSLARYGPETAEARAQLRQSVERTIHRIWPENHAHSVHTAELENAAAAERLQDHIRHLKPANDDQRAMWTQAQQTEADLIQLRWLLLEQEQLTLAPALLWVLLFWLFTLYTSFGLLAPRNITAYGALLVCAVSISAALFLIVEMNGPLEGVIKVSDAPMREALKVISAP